MFSFSAVCFHLRAKLLYLRGCLQRGAFWHIQVCVFSQFNTLVLCEHRLHMPLRNSQMRTYTVAKWVLFCCLLHLNGLKSLVFKPRCLKTHANDSTAMSCEHVTAIETIVQNLYWLTNFYHPYRTIHVIFRDVNVNALTHAINLKILMRYIFFAQINRLIRFDHNFFPSSQRGRLSIIVWWGYSEQCCHCGTSGCGLFWKYSHGKNYRAVGCDFFGLLYNLPRPPKVYIDK